MLIVSIFLFFVYFYYFNSKEQLSYQSTYRRLISKTAWETEDYVNDIIIGFKTKNAFNLELEYTVRCMINSENQFATFDVQETK